MISISSYGIYITKCCHDVFNDPMYTSSNAETVFRTLDPTVECICGKTYVKSDLDFVGFMRKTINDLKLVGLADIEILSFHRKSR